MQNVSRITTNMQDRKVMQDSYNWPLLLLSAAIDIDVNRPNCDFNRGFINNNNNNACKFQRPCGLCTWCLLGGSCRNTVWRIYRGQTAMGGTLHVGPRTIQQCLDYCNDTASCVGVDIDVNRVPVRCWVHVNDDDLLPDNIYVQQGTDSYKLIKRCPKSPSGILNIHVISYTIYTTN